MLGRLEADPLGPVVVTDTFAVISAAEVVVAVVVVVVAVVVVAVFEIAVHSITIIREVPRRIEAVPCKGVGRRVRGRG